MKLEFCMLVIFGLMGHILGYSIQEKEFVHRKKLTEEEEMLANQARAEIANAVENNLVRIFAIITAQNERGDLLHARQDEDGDDEIVTPNPNVLPQVAQILGAIFSGTLNITRIADGTVGLVPNFVRNQLQGLVKLLTGETVNLSGSSTTTVPPANKKVTTEVDVIFGEEDPSTVASLAVVPIPTAAPPTEPPTTQQLVIDASLSDTGNVSLDNKNRYRVRNKTRRTTTISPEKATIPVDDEIERIERELRAAAKILEPYETREPRFYAGLFSNLLKNVNMTEVAKAVPSVFKGATQAIVMLENLGVLETLPGSEAFGDLEELVGLEEE